MLKREVREMVKYLVGERKSFKVVFANDQVEVVEYRGYCWVIGNKGYSNEELIEKMVRYQNNERKFIIKFEVIEELEEVEESIEESLVEEVENLTDDLFQESDIAYAEEAIERESNNGGNSMNKNNDIEKYNQFAEKRRKEITDKINPTYYGTGFDVIDFCQMNNLDFMQGNVIKYVTRYKEKNGKEDLLKAIEYIKRIIKEMESHQVGV